MRTCDTVRFVFDAIVTRCGVQANIVVFVLGNGMKCRFAVWPAVTDITDVRLYGDLPISSAPS